MLIFPITVNVYNQSNPYPSMLAFLKDFRDVQHGLAAESQRWNVYGILNDAIGGPRGKVPALSLLIVCLIFYFRCSSSHLCMCVPRGTARRCLYASCCWSSECLVLPSRGMTLALMVSSTTTTRGSTAICDRRVACQLRARRLATAQRLDHAWQITTGQ